MMVAVGSIQGDVTVDSSYTKGDHREGRTDGKHLLVPLGTPTGRLLVAVFQFYSFGKLAPP